MTLQFTFQQDYDYFGLDDVQVTRTTIPAAPVIQSATFVGQSFQFSWTTTPSSLYQVQYKNSLSQTNWVNLGTPITAPGNSLNATDTISTNVQRFYRVMLLN
jgi:hypothetical protein